MDTTVVTVVGMILEIVPEGTFTFVKEGVFENLDQCWAFASAFNERAKGSGFVATCWPLVEAAIEVTR